jgi:hypothetical protein
MRDRDVGGYEIEQGVFDRLVAVAERWGVQIGYDWNEPEGARFIGTFKGREITLFPKYDSRFALFFTVSHLYGHMVQLTRTTEGMRRSIGFVYRRGTTLAEDEVQCIYDYEVEAAAIGRRLIAELGEVERALDAHYSRMFLADFHYLIDTIEDGRGGPESFERFLRREPVPWRLIPPDPRPLVDLRISPPEEIPITVL